MKRKQLEEIGLTKEALEKAGLSDDVIDKIMDINGTDIESAKSKSKEPELLSQVEDLQKRLEEATTQIESFKGMKPEEVESQINDWKAKLKEAETTHKETIAQMKKDNVLRDALRASGARDIKSVLPHIKVEDLKFNEGEETFTGLDDQIKGLKEGDYSYLFHSEKQVPRVVSGGGKSGGDEGGGTFKEAITERLQASSKQQGV